MKLHNPMQNIYANNQDILNQMFLWENSFNVYVFRLDGSVEIENAITV